MTLQFGRRPPKNAPALELRKLLTGVVPAHPASADYLAALHGGWQMLGNDQYGDCVAVTWANVRRLVTSSLTSTPNYPTLEQVETFYKTQNPGFPGEDNGMDTQTALEALVSDGGPDGVKAVAFAKVDYTNADEVKAALAIFGFVWTGINVQDAQMNQFNAGQPWDYVKGSALDGGHSVVTGGYGPQGTLPGALGGDEKFITWAQETSFTDTFWSKEVEEAWVVIWPEHFGTEEFEQGIDLNQLAADYQTITGRVLPVPTPQPTPIPTPTPTPTPQPTPTPTPANPDEALVLATEAWTTKRHEGETEQVALAIKAWRQAKGL